METGNFYAPVEKVLTSEISPKFLTNSYNEYSIVVTIGEDKVIVSQCSKDYALIPNREIFPDFEKDLKKEFSFNVKYKERNFSQFYADYILQGKILKISEKDQLTPMIRVSHSYNKSNAFKVSFGFYRLICTNGLFTFKVDEEYNYKHFIGNHLAIFEKVRMAANYFISQSEKRIEIFQILQDRVVKDPEKRIEEVIKGTRYLKRSQQEIVTRVLFEQSQLDCSITDWLIYNAFNYQLNHNEEINSPEERKMRIDREIFNFIVKNE